MIECVVLYRVVCNESCWLQILFSFIFIYYWHTLNKCLKITEIPIKGTSFFLSFYFRSFSFYVFNFGLIIINHKFYLFLLKTVFFFSLFIFFLLFLYHLAHDLRAGFCRQKRLNIECLNNTATKVLNNLIYWMGATIVSA